MIQIITFLIELHYPKVLRYLKLNTSLYRTFYQIVKQAKKNESFFNCVKH